MWSLLLLLNVMPSAGYILPNLPVGSPFVLKDFEGIGIPALYEGKIAFEAPYSVTRVEIDGELAYVEFLIDPDESTRLAFPQFQEKSPLDFEVMDGMRVLEGFSKEELVRKLAKGEIHSHKGTAFFEINSFEIYGECDRICFLVKVESAKEVESGKDNSQLAHRVGC